MRLKKASVLLSILLIIICVALLWFLILKQDEISLETINENITVENIKLGMSEQDVIALWGEGIRHEGFGGFQRDYKNKGILIGFSGDRDNDLYGRVSSLQISNSKYSIFSIKVGEDRESSIASLVTEGFKSNKEHLDLYENGEYCIQLDGVKVETITIWFADKELKDRIY
ncbi:hypothetical protein I6N90_07560 [Paenibacillus sp. GSMTC-2017]|uniref:hypothetical protein n=1 Tax=Paenibacillus sp. GSMTC-2017 TaxID=2794350 RepID=UPI0018DA28E8|nr:hypothetical protein [Paenibacillus sp. GSMTC-2017]MBH5317656.1 hypothetical protein [Paenibacillus sp. GSMTC-2017]